MLLATDVSATNSLKVGQDSILQLRRRKDSSLVGDCRNLSNKIRLFEGANIDNLPPWWYRC
jgi:hypothetical protein